VQELHARRNRESRFPDLIGAVDCEGQVARDPVESGLGTSAFSKSKETRRNSEVPSCDGSHGDAWSTTRGIAHRRSGF
jgi:hypothetical protein